MFYDLFVDGMKLESNYDALRIQLSIDSKKRKQLLYHGILISDGNIYNYYYGKRLEGYNMLWYL